MSGEAVTLEQHAAALEPRALELARYYLERYGASRFELERLADFDPELARRVRDVVAASFAQACLSGGL